jgi:hypothetical protein
MKAFLKPLLALGALAGALTVLVAATDKPASPPPATAATPTAPAAGTDPEAILEEKPPVGTLPAGFQPSESLRDVVKMAQAGVSEDVLLTYIRGAGKAFHPSPEDIIFLNDLGVGEAVLKALIDSRDGATAAPTAKPTAIATTVPASVMLSSNTPVTAAPAINGVVAQPAADAPPAPAADATTIVVTEPAPVTSVNYFYDSLAPYGSWVNLAGYGWCWQPTVAVVNVGWRPYCDNGRWVYSNYGWYWHSSYSWGWAPFHYGRWHQHASRGWLWQPDTVWGASWVSWRYSSQYCGWAPLPPAAHYRPGFGFSYYNGNVSVGINFDFGLSYHHYNYVPVNRFCDPHPRHHVARRGDVQAIHNHTTVINNYVAGDNNTVVINRGIDRDRIARGGRAPIPEVTVRDAAVRAGAPGNGTTRIERDGARDIVYRPVLGRPSVAGIERDNRRGSDPRGATPTATVAGGNPIPPGRTPPTRVTPATPAPNTASVTPPAPSAQPPTKGGPALKSPPTPRGTGSASATASETPGRSTVRNERLEQLLEDARRNNQARDNRGQGNPPSSVPVATPPGRGPTRPGAPTTTPAPAPSANVVATPIPPVTTAPVVRPTPSPTPAAAPNGKASNGRVSNERMNEMIRELQNNRSGRPQAATPNPVATVPVRPTPAPAPAPVQRESTIIRLPQQNTGRVYSQPATPAPSTPAPAATPAPAPRQQQSGYRPTRELPSNSGADRSRVLTVPNAAPRSQPTPSPSPAPSSPAPSVRSAPATPSNNGGGSVQSNGGGRSSEPRGNISRGNSGNSNGRGRGDDR